MLLNALDAHHAKGSISRQWVLLLAEKSTCYALDANTASATAVPAAAAGFPRVPLMWMALAVHCCPAGWSATWRGWQPGQRHELKLMPC